jgi:hypothetical protein
MNTPLSYSPINITGASPRRDYLFSSKTSLDRAARDHGDYIIGPFWVPSNKRFHPLAIGPATATARVGLLLPSTH